jgi:hypothetical protein
MIVILLFPILMIRLFWCDFVAPKHPVRHFGWPPTRPTSFFDDSGVFVPLRRTKTPLHPFWAAIEKPARFIH